MAVYIKGAAVLSPQKTFGDQGFPVEIAEYANATMLKCIEPVYRDFLDPMASRRMSRIVKMGVCSALKCLHDCGVEMPDAIITGTGLGCLEDTGKFLSSVYTNDEKLLNPTPFIQSTHNTVAGAIALAIKCHHYNATYTHRGFSFENALEDAIMQLEINPEHNILAGGFDELTDTVYAITKRLGLWKNCPVNSPLLLEQPSRGSLPGEGVAFFMLSGKAGNHSMARLKLLRTFYKPAGEADIAARITGALTEAGMDAGGIDLAIIGLNGDNRTDRLYTAVTQHVLSQVPYAAYKHLCGEYDTSSAFALWLGAWILQHQQVPPAVLMGDKKPSSLNTILIYNHLRGINHALYILERC